VLHTIAEERSRLWQLQAQRPTQDRADRIVQLTKSLNGHADDILSYPTPLWSIEDDGKRQNLDYARGGGVYGDRRKDQCLAKRR
jgi:hypothetical protein